MSIPFVSRGFHGRRERTEAAQRLPPGQGGLVPKTLNALS